jgi:hypothetical protein
MEMQGNTSINPFFYGTYLAETKPYEPVLRNKNQAFQADAVGVLHQLTEAHFNTTHTFRLEWQPGPGGRLDWFSKGHKINATFSMEGDGLGQDWVHAYSLKDKTLRDLMGSQIPAEPTYLIMNTAVSSTWGFPYDAPDWCVKCFDCNDPKCQCAMSPGFCKMLQQGDVAMYIDSIRVYQTNEPHLGNNHTTGCDPPDFPTKEFIQGHSYRYMRNPPFSYEDKHPLRPVQRGGADCKTDSDCGAHIQKENLTQIFEQGSSSSSSSGRKEKEDRKPTGRGMCVDQTQMQAMFFASTTSKVCKCNEGYTGPNCLALDHIDDSPSAHALRSLESPFRAMANLYVTPFMFLIVGVLAPALLAILIIQVWMRKRRPKQVLYTSPDTVQKDHRSISGRSV